MEPEVTEPKIYRVPECNMPELQKRIGKLNKRATKLKLLPLVLTETGEEFEERTKQIPDPTKGSGYRLEKYTIRLVLLTLIGSCPRVNGWQMAATIQHAEGGNVLRTVPGFETTLPVKFRKVTRDCEHCNMNRNRNDTYVLVSEIGSWKQVGRNCLADFLRSSDASGIAEWAEMLANLDEEMCGYEDEESFGFSGRGERYFTALKLLTQVACCIRGDGWCSRTEARNDFNKLATVDWAMSLWDDKVWNKLKKSEQEKYTITELDTKRAVEAIDWAQNLPEDVTNDYLWNIRVVSTRALITGREAGLAGSIVSAYNRFLENELKRQYEKVRPSEWFGEIKDKVTVTVTITGLRPIQGQYGLTTLVMMLCPDGNKAKWWCSGDTTMEIGKTYEVTGTIQDHDEYQGSKATILTRVKIKREIAAATA